ncbi:tyrosine phosphatase family protein [Methylocystis heyeri]|uniref:Protein tyrosine phosphatase n=1 Tax=Methylocystis heyeri TaxID=391905 RepID=A0A6B8K7R2_9HYPH|nr:protein tyrosine phosphatase [Methylocystis heyeri]QGM44244.1 protein tyrosine phosphatase [Methylocystis heyeri]
MKSGCLYVCPLRKVVDTVRTTGARSLVTILTAGASSLRPSEIEPPRHLRLSVSDIETPLDGHILPGAEHVESLLAFLRNWDREQPLVIHCYAGVSRSPAAAFVGACALEPSRSELEIAQSLRLASPTATPNRRFVELADRLLGRQGRMVEAVAAIGRGADCFEGTPFAMELG